MGTVASAKAVQREIAALLGQLAVKEGPQSSAIEGVTLVRVTRAFPLMPVLYEPSAVFVGAGSKRGFVGNRSFEYLPGRFLLLLNLPLPFACETCGSPEHPLLALYVRLRAELIAEMAALSPPEKETGPFSSNTIEASTLDGALAVSVLRLLEAMRDPEEARLLGKQLVREIHFRLLKSEQGVVLRSSEAFGEHFGQISRAVEMIHRNYAKRLNVTQLAEYVAMSPSLFHSNLKKITSTSPLQYQKALRLHNARSLILDEGIGAAAAATRVGYESASQFGREYKRLFGYSPLTEAARIRSCKKQEK